MKLLHVDSSILGANSISRQVSAAVVDRLQKKIADLDVKYRDLAALPFAHLSGDHLAAAQGAVPEAPIVQEDIATSQAALEEFLSADIVVIGAPMYNFTIPSQLKAWIDRVLVAGQTFRYSASGPEGLVGSKRVIIILSRGGLYGPDSAAAPAEHVETYLRAVFGFIGVATPEFILAEGLQMGPEPRERALAGALHAASDLLAA
jgi:FMN-dependent NADH-azoreductase